MSSFFIQSMLTKAIYYCRHELEDLSKLLLSDADTFMQACEKVDSNMVNGILESYMLKYIKADNINVAFYKFCDKFGIEANLTGKDIPEIVQIIAGHSNEISAKLAKAGY